MNPSNPRCLLTIDSDHDAQTPARVLGLVTLRNVIPDWFSVRQLGDGSLRIVMELRQVDAEGSALLAKRIANFPCVTKVSQTWIGARAPLAP